MRVVLSYAEPDAKHVEELVKRLTALHDEYEFECWHRALLDPGDDHLQRSREHLNHADIIILLVTPDFFASHHCREADLPLALARVEEAAAQVVPLIVRPTLWQSSHLARLQPIPLDGRPITAWPNPDEAWLDVAQQLRAMFARRSARPVASQLQLGEYVWHKTNRRDLFEILYVVGSAHPKGPRLIKCSPAGDEHWEVYNFLEPDLTIATALEVQTFLESEVDTATPDPSFREFYQASIARCPVPIGAFVNHAKPSGLVFRVLEILISPKGDHFLCKCECLTRSEDLKLYAYPSTDLLVAELTESERQDLDLESPITDPPDPQRSASFSEATAIELRRQRARK